MPVQMVRYDVLLSCPSDVQDMIQDVQTTVDEVNHVFENDGLYFRLKHWSKNVLIDYGTPQLIINKQIVDSTDAVIALFGSKLGTPTAKYESGTIEEIAVVAENHGQVFVFFAEKIDANIAPREYEKLSNFKERYKNSGLFKEYGSVSGLRDQLKNQLILYGNSLKTPSIGSVVAAVDSPVVVGYANKNQDNMHAQVRQANSISILSNTGYAFLKTYKKNLVHAIQHNHCQVKILIAHESNDVFTHLAPRSS